MNFDPASYESIEPAAMPFQKQMDQIFEPSGFTIARSQVADPFFGNRVGCILCHFPFISQAKLF